MHLLPDVYCISTRTGISLSFRLEKSWFCISRECYDHNVKKSRIDFNATSSSAYGFKDRLWWLSRYPVLKLKRRLKCSTKDFGPNWRQEIISFEKNRLALIGEDGIKAESWIVRSLVINRVIVTHGNGDFIMNREKEAVCKCMQKFSTTKAHLLFYKRRRRLPNELRTLITWVTLMDLQLSIVGDILGIKSNRIWLKSWPAIKA